MDATTEETVQPNATPPADTSAPPASTAADGSATLPANVEQGPDGKFRNPVQPRIDELTRKAHEATRNAEYWQRRAQSLENPPALPPAPAPKPTADQFDDYGAFVEALTDWKADQKIKASDEQRDTRTAEQKREESRKTNWQQREAAVRAAVPDYDTVMAGADSVPVTKAVEQELLDSERGPELALHLAKNPDVAEKLNGLSDRALAKEIGRLEASLPAVSAPTPTPNADDPPADPPAAAAPTAPAARTTTAPPPAKPTGAARSTATPLAKLPMDDYVAQRKAQGASWARR